jgi:hypothetical protein
LPLSWSWKVGPLLKGSVLKFFLGNGEKCTQEPQGEFSKIRMTTSLWARAISQTADVYGYGKSCAWLGRLSKARPLDENSMMQHTVT